MRDFIEHAPGVTSSRYRKINWEPNFNAKTCKFVHYITNNAQLIISGARKEKIDKVLQLPAAPTDQAPSELILSHHLQVWDDKECLMNTRAAVANEWNGMDWNVYEYWFTQVAHLQKVTNEEDGMEEGPVFIFV